MKTTSWKMDKRSRKAKRGGVDFQEFDRVVQAIDIEPGMAEDHRLKLIGHGLSGEPVYQCLDCDDEHAAS